MSNQFSISYSKRLMSLSLIFEVRLKLHNYKLQDDFTNSGDFVTLTCYNPERTCSGICIFLLSSYFQRQKAKRLHNPILPFCVSMTFVSGQHFG